MRKTDAESIVTTGVDTTDMTPKEVEALIAQEPSPEEVEFYQLLRGAEKRLLEGPDYTAINAQFDKIERRKVGETESLVEQLNADTAALKDEATLMRKLIAGLDKVA